MERMFDGNHCVTGIKMYHLKMILDALNYSLDQAETSGIEVFDNWDLADGIAEADALHKHLQSCYDDATTIGIIVER